MKLAKDIKVGDIPYSCHYRANGIAVFRQLPNITSIVEDSSWYLFKCGRFDYDFRMSNKDCCYGVFEYETTESIDFVIVPENAAEIEFLNRLLAANYQTVETHIQRQLRNVLGL